ncbi:MAG TPA: ABC transporter permease [Thermoanaerobaculia bacterium]|nr:ABC transporter permease [Thermoanaerobaculia bacterium]
MIELFRDVRRDLVAPIRAGAVAAAGGRSGPRRALVVVQVALAAALLVGAGLLLRSLGEIHREEAGYRIAGVHLLSLYFPDEPGSAPGKAELRLRRYDALVEEIRALPGVTAAGLTARPPLFGGAFGESLEVAGRGGEEDLHTNLVDAAYLETLGVPIVEGRGLERRDRRGAPGAVVVNRTLAESVWPGESAVGKAFVLPSSSRPEERGQRFEVVGVVADHRYSKLTDPPGPLVYFPLAQRPRDRVTVLLRAEVPTEALAPPLRDLLRREHPALSVIDLVPLEEQVRRSLFEERLHSTVAGAVGLLGLALAALGLASLMAFAVGRRRREIGVRMAVGAAPADAVRLVLRQAAGLVGAGLALGLLAALTLGRLLAGMLHGVESHDPVSFAAVAAALGAAGLAAAWLPARSAARIDPAAVLRSE